MIYTVLNPVKLKKSKMKMRDDADDDMLRAACCVRETVVCVCVCVCVCVVVVVCVVSRTWGAGNTFASNILYIYRFLHYFCI